MTEGLFFDFAAVVQHALGLAELEIEWVFTENPGGDARNAAFVRAGPDLRQFDIEYDFADCDDREIRVIVVHELLHIALRHIGGLLTTMKGTSKIWAPLLEQALEEDTEALASQLEHVLADIPMFMVNGVPMFAVEAS